MGIKWLHPCAERAQTQQRSQAQSSTLGSPSAPNPPGKCHAMFPQSFLDRCWPGRLQRTYTSDSLVPVNKGLPEDQPPRHPQVLKAEDKGTEKPGTKPEVTAILSIASVLTSWGKRVPGSPLSCSQPLQDAVDCCSAFHRESGSQNT